MSLRFKIIVASILCIILTFSPLLYILQTQVKTLNMKQIEDQTLQLIDSKANEIGSWLNQRISEIRIIQEYPPTKELDFTKLKPYLTELNKALKKQYGNPNETFAIGGIQGQGWINDEITIDISNRDYFKKAMSGDLPYVISEPVISKSDNTPIFLICYPIINDDGEKIGFINGSVNLAVISEIVDNIKIYNGFSWVMNKNMDTYSITREELECKYISCNSLKTIVDNLENKNSGTILLNNKSTVFYSSIPYTEEWILCTIVENSQIHAQTNKIINIVVFVGIILLLAAILLAIVVSGSIVKPIQRLKYNMLEVSKGNLNTYYEIKKNDEISVLGYVFNQMLSDIKELINKVYKVQVQKRNAELKALQYQINPHFLYNVLDTIQWKALDYNAFEVADMINSLSVFFRISLSDGKEFITILDETEHIRNYLEIQKIRYKDKISYNLDLDNSIGQYMVPKMIIQPLVENSIYHGIKPKRGNGIINIKISFANNRVHILVEDNGVGIDEEKLRAIRKNLDSSIGSENYGLYNVNERLKLYFKDKYSIFIESERGIKTKVILKIPVISEGFECLE